MDLEVCMQQSLELKGDISVIGNNQGCVQAVRGKRDAVKQTELVWPQLPDILVKVIG